MKKNIQFGAWGKNEIDVENNIMTFHFSTNYGFELVNGKLETTIEGKKWIMCWIGSNPKGYLKFQVKPILKDDVSYKTFLKTVEAVGENWRTNAAVLTLIEGIEFRSLENTRYGFNNLKDGKEPLIGLIPVDHKYHEISESWWNDYTSEYDTNIIKEAIPA